MSLLLYFAVVTLQIDGALTRSIFEGDFTDICVSKNIETVRAVNFSLTPMDESTGGIYMYVQMYNVGVSAMYHILLYIGIAIGN